MFMMLSMKIIQGPTIERGRRCQNCTQFDNGPVAVRDYKMRRFAEMQRNAVSVLQRDGVPVDPRKALASKDPEAALGANYDLGDQYIKSGLLGVCRKGMTRGDFVHAYYLCDRWDERVRPDGAEKPDELPEEARARLLGDDE